MNNNFNPWEDGHHFDDDPQPNFTMPDIILIIMVIIFGILIINLL